MYIEWNFKGYIGDNKKTLKMPWTEEKYSEKICRTAFCALHILNVAAKIYAKKCSLVYGSSAAAATTAAHKRWILWLKFYCKLYANIIIKKKGTREYLIRLSLHFCMSSPHRERHFHAYKKLNRYTFNYFLICRVYVDWTVIFAWTLLLKLNKFSWDLWWYFFLFFAVPVC